MKTETSQTKTIGDFLGAFADGAVLFPLVAVLSMKEGFSGSLLLFTAGVAYLVAGYFFRVPMSVQPLKSIAIAAVTLGASFSEVRLSAMLLGLFCFGISFTQINQWAQKVPSTLVQGIQASLGVMLISQGLKSETSLWVLGSVLAMILLPSWKGVTAMGLAATGGILWSVIHSAFDGSQVPLVKESLQSDESVRWMMVLSLLLPQLALTSANSVVGTADVARRYFGEQASRVTVDRLYRMIGIGNLISSLVGGLPFCHGAGGVTAHYRAGARHWIMNVYIGVFCILLAGLPWLFFTTSGQAMSALQFPKWLLSALLISTGVLHLRLSEPTLKYVKDGVPVGALQLLGMIAAVLIGQNILWSLAVGLCFEWGVVLFWRLRAIGS
jgi:MFS superfamily sulfate permease-like transporter